MPGVIGPASGGDTFEVEFTCEGGEQYVINELMSAEEAKLVCDVLTIKEALDGGASLQPLLLYNAQGPPRWPACLPGWLAGWLPRSAGGMTLVNRLRRAGYACIVRESHGITI